MKKEGSEWIRNIEPLKGPVSGIWLRILLSSVMSSTSNDSVGRDDTWKKKKNKPISLSLPGPVVIRWLQLQKSSTTWPWGGFLLSYKERPWVSRWIGHLLRIYAPIELDDRCGGFPWMCPYRLAGSWVMCWKRAVLHLFNHWWTQL